MSIFPHPTYFPLMDTMFRINIDLKPLEASLTSLQQKQFPFAASKALNDTAWDVYWNLRKAIPKIFDRPTPWTVKAMYVEKSTKKTLIAEVGYKAWASKGTAGAKVLSPHILGGSRPFKRSEKLLQQAGKIPPGTFLVRASQAPRDEYGNVSKALISKMISGLQANLDTAQRSKGKKAKRFFIDRMHGGNGNLAIFQRLYGDVVPLFMVVKSVTYKPVYPIQKMVDEVVKQRFPGNFERAMDMAMRTAK